MDHSEKLEKLQQLLDGGIITQEEFDAKKEQIMKQTEAATTEAVVEEVEVVEFAVADNEASTAAPVLQGTADDDLQSKRAALIEDLAGIGVVSSLPRSGLPIEKCTVGWLLL